MYVDIAWECLKRNETYKDSWSKSGKEQRQPGHSYENLDANFWGLINFVDPQAPSPIDVFWSQSVSKNTIYAKKEKCHGDGSHLALNIKKGLLSNELKVNENKFFIKFFNDKGCIQLITNESIGVPSGLFSLYFIITDENLNDKLNTVSFLFNDNTTLLNKNMLSILECLDFYDLKKEGLTHKEIAKIKYPAFFSEDEWLFSDWLRGRVRYKIKKAESYINGKYLDLL